jgi:hypothetical protein
MLRILNDFSRESETLMCKNLFGLRLSFEGMVQTQGGGEDESCPGVQFGANGN